MTATEIKIGAQHEVLNACSFLASPLAALLSPSLYLAQLDILTSFAPRAFTLCCFVLLGMIRATQSLCPAQD